MTAANSPDIGMGTLIRVGATMAAITATVALARARNVTPPPYSRDAVDVTSLDSPGHTREFMPGLIDRGDCTLEILWVPGDPTDDVIREMMAERETRLIEVSFPQIASPVPTCSFRAFLTGYEPGGVTPEGEMTASITLKVTGVPTWTNV